MHADCVLVFQICWVVPRVQWSLPLPLRLRLILSCISLCSPPQPTAHSKINHSTWVTTSPRCRGVPLDPCWMLCSRTLPTIDLIKVVSLFFVAYISHPDFEQQNFSSMFENNPTLAWNFLCKWRDIFLYFSTFSFQII